MALLETQKLDKWFGGLHVTGEIDFEVADGEIHCLVGPNGAGKSTFFRLILGQFPPTGGRILFKGEDITSMPSHERINRGISVKFQVPGVFNEMSVLQNLQVALQRRLAHVQEVAEEADRLLGFLNLREQTSQSAGNLSHGQKQWLEIGMAVALQPTLLLLDEPTAGMTPDETVQTGRMIQELNKAGMAVLAVEHDMSFVRQVAQRVTVLNYGKIFASGTIAEIEQHEGVVEIYLGKAHG